MTLLPTPRRNFSPWYQVVSRLMATEEPDGLPGRSVGRSRPGAERFTRPTGGHAGPMARRRCPSTSRSPRTWPVTATGGRRIVFDTEADMSVPAYLLVPDGRRRAGLGGAGRPRARTGQVPDLRPRRPRGRPRQRLRRRAGPPRPCGPGPGPAVLRRAGRLEPRRPLRLRHQPGPPGHGRVEPAHPEPLGPGARPRRARGPSTGRPGPDRRGRLLLRGDDDAVPGRHRPSGGRRRGQRLLLVVVRGAQGPVEHVRLPGALRDAGPHGARRPGGTGGPPPAAGRERPRRPPVPAGRLGGRPGPVAAALRTRRGRRPSGP